MSGAGGPVFAELGAEVEHAVYQPLPPYRVRWYAVRAPYSRKGMLEAPELPHRGSLLRFCDADNAMLEAAYCACADELQRLWWEEEADLSHAASSKQPPPSDAAADPAPPTWADFMVTDAGEAVGVPVRSGVYEVDLPSRVLRPCYWPAARHRVMRGTWFAEKGGEWVPLRESLAEQLEQAQASAIWENGRGRLQRQPDGSMAARLQLTTSVNKGLYAMFVSADEAWLMRDSSFAWLKAVPGASAAAAPTKMRLRRGYATPALKAFLDKEADLKQEEADNAAAATPPSQVLLVVHGIGQNLQGANIAVDALAVRSMLRTVEKDAAATLAAATLASSAAATEGAGKNLSAKEAAEAAAAAAAAEAAAAAAAAVAVGRVEVLPVQWRKTMNLEMDQLAARLMPPGIAGLRQVLHSTATEVLLYLTPLHRAEVLCSLAGSLNSVYAKFMLRNPAFSGTVSIMAHSLGSVLCWDILCNQQQPWRLPAPGHDINVTPEPQQPQQQLTGGLPSAADAAASRGSPAACGWGRQLSGDSSLQEAAAAAAVGEGAAEEADEVARLRSENKRLLHELHTLRSPPPATTTIPTASSSAPPPFHLNAISPEVPGGTAVSIPHLHFSVDTLILMGSPLGCFLALRGVNAARNRGLGMPRSSPLMQCDPAVPAAPDGLPATRRLYNLFHPFDPVAYRLEPLAYAEREVRRPPFVPCFGGGKRLHIAAQELGEDVTTAASRLGSTLAGAFTFGRGSKPAAATAAAATSPITAGTAAAGAATGTERGGEGSSAEFDDPLPDSAAGGPAVEVDVEVEADGAAPAETRVWRVAGGRPPASGSSMRSSGAGRLDFSLQENTLESQYLKSLSAHFAYWSSTDAALFVHRAVRGLDVLSGNAAAPLQELQAGTAAAPAAVSPTGGRGGAGPGAALHDQLHEGFTGYAVAGG